MTTTKNVCQQIDLLISQLKSLKLTLLEKCQPQSSQIQELPVEIICMILAHLEFKDEIRFAMTCTEYYQMLGLPDRMDQICCNGDCLPEPRVTVQELDRELEEYMFPSMVTRRLNPENPTDHAIMSEGVCGNCYETFDCPARWVSYNSLQKDEEDEGRDCYEAICGHFVHRECIEAMRGTGQCFYFCTLEQSPLAKD